MDKNELFKTAVTRAHIFTESAARDIPANTVVAVRYRCRAFNALRKEMDSIYSVTLQNGTAWGDMYATNLTNFVL